MFMNKMADKILKHFLFFDFLHERSLIIDIEIVISIALETSYEASEEKQQLNSGISILMTETGF